MIRILHFSDVHVNLSAGEVPPRELLSKRAIGMANLWLRRGRHFRDVEKKLDAMAAFAEAQHIDAVICTGDYTTLGTEAEIRAARSFIAPLTRAPLGFVTVPGNHDIYVDDVLEDHRFDRHFGDLMSSDLPDLASDGRWPTVRLLGDEVAVIAVNAARPNAAVWRSSGLVPPAQVAGLRRALADDRVRSRFVIVALHYALCLADGRPDRPLHGLVNADAVIEACRELRAGAIVHGHVHHRYQASLPRLRVPIFGAGSATHSGREGFWMYELGRSGGRAHPGVWSGSRYLLERDNCSNL